MPEIDDIKLQNIFDFTVPETHEEEILKYIYSKLSELGFTETSYFLIDDEGVSIQTYKADMLPFATVENDNSVFTKIGNKKTEWREVVKVNQSFIVRFFSNDIRQLFTIRENFLRSLVDFGFMSEISNDKAENYFFLDIEAGGLFSYQNIFKIRQLRALAFKLNFKYRILKEDTEPIIIVDVARINSDQHSDFDYAVVEKD